MTRADRHGVWVARFEKGLHLMSIILLLMIRQTVDRTESIVQLSHRDIEQSQCKLLMHAKILIAGRLFTHLFF